MARTEARAVIRPAHEHAGAHRVARRARDQRLARDVDVARIAECDELAKNYGKQFEAGVKAFQKLRGDTVAGRKVQVIVKDSGANAEDSRWSRGCPPSPSAPGVSSSRRARAGRTDRRDALDPRLRERRGYE